MPDHELQRVDLASDRAAYRQVADQLRHFILSGSLPPGAQLPSEARLIEETGTSRVTVRRGLAQLQAEGLIVAQRGRGVFVRDDRPLVRLGRGRLRSQAQRGFYADLQEQGRKPKVQTSIRQAPVPADLAPRLGVEPGDKVLSRYRVMGQEDGPVLQLATSYFAPGIAERLPILGERDTGPGGMYARMEDLGLRLHWQESVAARMPRPEEAAALALPAGVPILRVIRTTFDQDEHALEVMDTVLSSALYELVYDLPE